jgi:hypothetical protein
LHDVAYNRFGGLIIVIFCMAAWIGVQHLGYSEFGLAGRLLFRGQLRSIIDAQLRLQQFERELSSAATIDEFWRRLTAGCKEFGLAGARLGTSRKASSGPFNTTGSVRSSNRPSRQSSFHRRKIRGDSAPARHRGRGSRPSLEAGRDGDSHQILLPCEINTLLCAAGDCPPPGTLSPRADRIALQPARPRLPATHLSSALASRLRHYSQDRRDLAYTLVLQIRTVASGLDQAWT